MRVRRHPGHQTLSLYVDDELTEGRRTHVVEHLEGCLKCQREVDFMLEAQRGLREIAKPRPPRDLLEHILERRNAGERIILPTAWASPRRLRPAIPAVAGFALAVLAAAVGVLILGSGEATAGASGMAFSPSNLARSEEIEIEYTTVGVLAAEPKLILRGRYLTADDHIQFGEGGTYFSTELWPKDGGTFRGRVGLPGSVVYAQFAVEDSEGEYVDHNGYRSWDLLAEYEDGRPKFEALWQRSRVYESRDPQEAYESIKQLTELYPDRVEAWSARYGYEKNVVASTLSETLERTHRAKFDEFFQRAVLGTLSASELGELVNYARRLNERSAQEVWTGLLNRLHPTDPIAVRERVEELNRTLESEPRALLIEFEREWEKVGPVQPILLQYAYNAAVRAHDASAIRRWSERLVSVRPARTGRMATDLARMPSLRAFAADLIRRELDRLERVSELERPVYLSVTEYRLENRRQRHDLLATLGRMLIEDGQAEAGIDTLLLAAETGWHPELFMELASLIGSRGDPETALRFHALAAIDPLARAVDLESAPGDIVRVTDALSWAEALEAAREEQQDRINATQVIRSPVDNVALRRPGGAVVPLDDLVGEAGTIAFLWSRWAQQAASMAKELGKYRDRLLAQGITILAITRDPDPEPALQDWRELGVDLPVYVDPRGEATTALQSFWIPDLLVLDADKRVRFDPVDLDEAVRAVLTLSPDS
jgi:hypothetical protein